jgi:hypothetical protein
VSKPVDKPVDNLSKSVENYPKPGESVSIYRRNAYKCQEWFVI